MVILKIMFINYIIIHTINGIIIIQFNANYGVRARRVLQQQKRNGERITQNDNGGEVLTALRRTHGVLRDTRSTIAAARKAAIQRKQSNCVGEPKTVK